MGHIIVLFVFLLTSSKQKALYSEKEHSEQAVLAGCWHGVAVGRSSVRSLALSVMERDQGLLKLRPVSRLSEIINVNLTAAAEPPLNQTPPPTPHSPPHPSLSASVLFKATRWRLATSPVLWTVNSVTGQPGPPAVHPVTAASRSAPGGSGRRRSTGAVLVPSWI